MFHFFITMFCYVVHVIFWFSSATFNFHYYASFSGTVYTYYLSIPWLFSFFLPFQITSPLTGPFSWCIVYLYLFLSALQSHITIIPFSLPFPYWSLFSLQALNHHQVFITIKCDVARCTKFMFSDHRKYLLQKLCDIFAGLDVPICLIFLNIIDFNIPKIFRKRQSTW